MEVRYHLDPDTGQPHIHGHGVTESEVEYVLRHPGEDRQGATIRVMLWARPRRAGICALFMCRTRVRKVSSSSQPTS
jgi:hypothetical protein